MNRRIFVFDILGLGVFSIIKNKIKFIKNTGMVRSVSTWKTSDANLKAGQLLDKMLASIKLDRTKVYISNVVNYRRV